MFDTMKIAGIIKQARIDQNMTQMQLADAMGVSYQAVSNWERGNSMPDISKLEDLCRVLEISVEQLLGMETPAAAAVTKVIAEEELTVEELTEVAPVLQPKALKKQLKAGKKRRKLKLDAIAELAPFLGQAELEELLEDVDPEDMNGLDELAPFLSKETLDRLVEKADPDDMDWLEDVAPFLSRETLDRAVERMSEEALEDIEDIAPFLSRETLSKVAARCMGAGKLRVIADLAPFLGHEILDKLVDDLIEAEFDPEEMDDFPFGDLSDLYPFISREAAGRLAKYLLACRNLEAMEDLMPFV